MSETPQRVTSVQPSGADGPVPADIIVLAHHERRLRRRRLVAQHGDVMLVDWAETTTLRDRDRLVLDDGRHVEVIAAEEDLLEVRGRDARHLARLAWQIGNRHLAAQIESDRLLIERDHVLRAMLEGLDALVRDVREPFEPETGAYGEAGQGGHSHGGHPAHQNHGHGHGHVHGHVHGHDHDDHDHGHHHSPAGDHHHSHRRDGR